MEEIDLFLQDAEEHMDKAVKHLVAELAKIRAGKASPAILDSLKVNYYGSLSPLSQVSSVTTPDARTITIRPWEKGLINEIEKAIRNSDLGLNPQNNGEYIIITVPPLTEERRRDLVKQAKHETEFGKVSVRNIRKNTNDALKKLLKEGVSEDAVKKAETDLQALTDRYVKKIDEVMAAKEQDIMHV
jgi:ribosome recycling factor